MREASEWWSWEIELSAHALKRMIDREFNEADLRAMMDDASACRPDADPGRWIAETRHDGRAWEVVVEPDERRRLLVVVTAYPVDEPA